MRPDEHVAQGDEIAMLHVLYCNHAPRIAAPSDLPTVHFDDRIGPDNGKRNSILEGLLNLSLFLIIDVGELVDLDFVLSNFIENLQG